MTISRTGQHGGDTPTDEEEPVMSRAEEKALYRPPHYWACAPDCFIPNSVIRKYIKFKGPPAHMIPQLTRPVKEIEVIKKKDKGKSVDSSDSTKKGKEIAIE
jgi:hypothetical protein